MTVSLSEDVTLWRLAESLPLSVERKDECDSGAAARAGRAGLGLDFLGHRSYRVGDDVRHVDWSLFARHHSLYVREFEDDSLGTLMLLVDGSGSMALGEPSKWQFARQLTKVFGFAALKALHAIVVGVAIDGEIIWMPRGVGRDFGQRVSSFLAAISPTGRGECYPAPRMLFGRVQPSHCLVLSDFLDQKHLWASMQGHISTPMTFCRISAPREFAVPSVGALLTDSERSGVTRQIQSENQRTRLESAITSHRRQFEMQVAKHPGTWCDALSNEPLNLAAERILACIHRRRSQRRHVGS